MGKREFNLVKTLSVLLSLGLLLAANQLANRLRRAGALPPNHPAAPALRATGENQPAGPGPNALNKNPRINFFYQ
jgi:hypothetical protein